MGANVRELKQAYWEARAILGFDNDGDPTPDALTHPPFPELMRRDATEFRKDYDDACDEADKFRRMFQQVRAALVACHKGAYFPNGKPHLYQQVEDALKATEEP